MPPLPFLHRFRPRLIDALQDYNRARLLRDTAAGVTVAFVALPLAMAFAIASGLPPAAGLFTAIISGFFISALGGSKVQIGGPAGAFIVIVYGIIERYGVANLLLSTIFAGILLMLMGWFKLGALIRFIPVPIIIGFTNGIAVLIALSQVKEFFGLDIAKMPGDFVAQVTVLLRHAGSVNLHTLALSGGALLFLILWPRPGQNHTSRWRQAAQHIPGPIIVLILGVIAVTLFQWPSATIGSRFGNIPQALPAFQAPEFDWIKVKQLFAPTITIALLGAIESLLCARVADNLTGDKHDPNQELIAQGIANTITPFFAGMPATGTIARTVTNIRSGATSPISGIIHAATLLIIVLAAAPLAQHIPLAVLAAILFMTAWNMGEWHEFARLKHFSNNYRIIMVGTFLLTVIFDLTVAVEVGMVLACGFFIYRVASLTQVEHLSEQTLRTTLPPGVKVVSVFGSLFFGAVDKIEALSDPQQEAPKVLIVKVNQLINIDTSGLDALQSLQRYLQRRGGHLILCGLNHQPLSLIERSGFLSQLGAENCVSELPQALARAKALAQ